MQLLWLFVVFSVICYGESTLPESFESGAGNVEPVDLEPFLEGPALDLKKSIIQAFSVFLNQVDQSLQRNATLAIRSVDQRLKNYNNLLEHHLPDVPAGTATSTTFDQFLEFMVEINKVFVDLDAGASKSPNSGETAVHTSMPFLDDVFLNLESNVKKELDQLQQWTINLLQEGIAQDIKSLPALQGSLRTEFLTPETKVLQNYEKSLQKHEDTFQNYSSPAVWKEYQASREKLLQIKV